MDDILYVAGDHDLHVVNVADSTAPALLASLTIGGDAYGVAAAANLVYFATGPNGLLIVDATDPALPVIMSALPSTAAENVLPAGSLRYVSDDEGGFLIADVSDPTAPVPVSQLTTPDPTRDVTVSDGIAYPASYTSGITVVDAGDPAAPVVLGTLDTTDAALCVASTPDACCAGIGMSGLLVVPRGCATVTAAPIATTPSFAHLAIAPNPSTGSFNVNYELGEPAVVSLAVYDLAGRLVRRLGVSAAKAESAYALRWDGRDDRGRPASAGVYLVTLRAAGQMVTKRAVRLVR